MTRETDPMLREQYCFGCGRHNPIGMHLVFERDGDGVMAWYVPREEDQGFPHVMHGGLLALLLDEAMGWAMYADHIFAVTAKMETRYRKVVGVDAPLLARAHVVRQRGRRIEIDVRQRGRRIEIEATISNAEGAVLVEASSLFLRMDAETEARALESFRGGVGGAAWQ
jgi:acyl-coenzyme A thioesterase PaaI-like protein